MADEVSTETPPVVPIPEVPTTVAHVPPVEPPPVTPPEPTADQVRLTAMETALTGMATQLTTLTAALTPAPPETPPAENDVITEESIRQEFYTDPVKAMDNHSKLRLQPFMDTYTQGEQARTSRDIVTAEQSITNLPRSAELLPQIKESLKTLQPQYRADPDTWLNAYHLEYGKVLSTEANKGAPSTLPTSDVLVASSPTPPSDSEVSIARKLGLSPEAYARGKDLPSSDKVLGTILAGVK